MKNTAVPGFFVFHLLHYFPGCYRRFCACLLARARGGVQRASELWGVGVSSQLWPRVPPGNLRMKGSGVALGSLAWTGK